MNQEYRSNDWNTYRMEHREPHRMLEPLEQEAGVAVELGACYTLKKIPRRTAVERRDGRR